jgi:hypothetical protein
VTNRLGALGDDEETNSKVVGALVRLARREGPSSCSTHNEAAAAALLSIGAWRGLAASTMNTGRPSTIRTRAASSSLR